MDEVTHCTFLEYRKIISIKFDERHELVACKICLTVGLGKRPFGLTGE